MTDYTGPMETGAEESARMTDKPFREQERFAGLPSHVYSYVAALEQRVERMDKINSVLLRHLKAERKNVDALIRQVEALAQQEEA